MITTGQPQLQSLEKRRADGDVSFSEPDGCDPEMPLVDMVSLTQREKNRLARFAKNLGSALNELATIVHPSTIRRWIREQAAAAAKNRKKQKTGRPRTAAQIESLILKLAKDNNWGYTRILGELKKLGIESVTRNTVKNILKRSGYETGPKRGPGTWDEFLQIHVKAMWQCDFFSKKVVSKTGLRDLFAIAFCIIPKRSNSPVAATESTIAKKFKRGQSANG